LDIVSEIVLVDGHSTDETISICSSHRINGLTKVIFISSHPNGVADAMNIGARNASSDYISFLNSDDYWNYSKEIASDLFQIKLFGNHDLYLMSCNYINNGVSSKKTVSLGRNRFLSLFVKNRIYHPSVVIRLEFFRKMGEFSLVYGTAFDYNFWLTSVNLARIKFSDLVLSTFRIHTDSLSYKFRYKATLELLDIRKKHSISVMYKAFAYVLFLKDIFSLIALDFMNAVKIPLEAK
jgi:glycosyltransferase involved in cell wall biosynthesis